MASGLKDVVRLIPQEYRDKLAEALLDLLLETKNVEAVTAASAKRILMLMKHDMLSTDMGLETLLNAALLAEPVKTLDVVGDVLAASMVVEEVINALAARAKEITAK